MKRKDLKKYSVYLPIRWEHESVFRKIEEICPGWCDKVWLSKYTGRHSCRVFWGERQCVRIPEKDGRTFRFIPIGTWLKISEGEMDGETWEWVRGQKKSVGMNESRRKRGMRIPLSGE